MTVQSIDKARAGRLVLALLDQDEEKAEAVVAEAVTDDSLPELLDAMTGAFVGFMRLTIGVDNARQWASDWILHAHTETHEHNQQAKRKPTCP